MFTPINDRLLVEELHEPEVTAGGIHIPESATERPTRGVVKFVGDGGFVKGGTFRPTQLKVGDTVLFGRYAGSTIKLEGKDYRILLEEDVFGKLTD